MYVNLSDHLWNEIKKAGSLRDDCRSPLTDNIKEYELHISSTKVSRKTKRLVSQAQDSASKLRGLLKRLTANAEFQHIGCNELKPSQLKVFDRVTRDLEKLDQELSKTSVRFKKVRRTIPHDESALGNYIWNVLEIRSRALRKPMPTSVSESAATGKYRKYVQLCVSAVDERIPAKQIERSLQAAIDLYQRVRSIDDAYTFEVE